MFRARAYVEHMSVELDDGDMTYILFMLIRITRKESRTANNHTEQFLFLTPASFTVNGAGRVQQTGGRIHGEAAEQGRGAELRDQKVESNDR